VLLLEAEAFRCACTSDPLPAGLVLVGDVASLGVRDGPNDGSVRFGTRDVSAGTKDDVGDRESNGTLTPPADEDGVCVDADGVDVVGSVTGDVNEPKGMAPRPLGRSDLT
jgi:hypothetical protein